MKVDKLVLITSGNNGYSLAQFARDSSTKVVCVVSRDIAPSIRIALTHSAYQVIELNLTHKILRPEELIAFAREKEDEVIWEVTNGYEEFYAPIVDEILKEVTPTYIVVPIGSGGIYIGIIRALERHRVATRVIGIGVRNMRKSFADKLYTPWTPYARALRHYELAGRHLIYRLTEDEVRNAYARFNRVVACEPSSSVVFAALEKHQFKLNDTVVFLNSGQARV